MKKILLIWVVLLLGMASSAGNDTFVDAVTFDKDIKPIFQKYCASCHFGSLNYDASYKNRNKILRKFVRSRQMPPKYVSERPNKAEILLVKQWIETGAKK